MSVPPAGDPFGPVTCKGALRCAEGSWDSRMALRCARRATAFGGATAPPDREAGRRQA